MDTNQVGKAGTFVTIAILAFAFSSSLGSPSARADDDSDDKTSVLDRPEYDPDYLQYQRAPSHWAIGLRGAFTGFPGLFPGAFKFLSAVGNSYQIFGEWVLPFQKSGVFSVGAHYGTIPLNSSATNATGNTIPFPSYQSQMGGLQFRYQARYFKNQWFVPTAAVDFDYYTVVIGGGQEDRASGFLVGINAGFMINLGAIDTATAREAYQTLNMTRTYLTLEIHPISFSNSSISFSGNLYYTGLRFEFE